MLHTPLLSPQSNPPLLLDVYNKTNWQLCWAAVNWCISCWGICAGISYCRLELYLLFSLDTMIDQDRHFYDNTNFHWTQSPSWNRLSILSVIRRLPLIVRKCKTFSSTHVDTPSVVCKKGFMKSSTNEHKVNPPCTEAMQGRHDFLFIASKWHFIY